MYDYWLNSPAPTSNQFANNVEKTNTAIITLGKDSLPLYLKQPQNSYKKNKLKCIQINTTETLKVYIKILINNSEEGTNQYGKL